MPFPISFTMMIPQGLLRAGGEETWIPYSAAATMEELEAHARMQKIPRWAIFVMAPVKSFPPENGAAAIAAAMTLAPSGPKAN